MAVAAAAAAVPGAKNRRIARDRHSAAAAASAAHFIACHVHSRYINVHACSATPAADDDAADRTKAGSETNAEH